MCDHKNILCRYLSHTHSWIEALPEKSGIISPKQQISRNEPNDKSSFEFYCTTLPCASNPFGPTAQKYRLKLSTFFSLLFVFSRCLPFDKMIHRDYHCALSLRSLTSQENPSDPQSALTASKQKKKCFGRKEITAPKYQRSKDNQPHWQWTKMVRKLLSISVKSGPNFMWLGICHKIIILTHHAVCKVSVLATASWIIFNSVIWSHKFTFNQLNWYFSSEYFCLPFPSTPSLPHACVFHLCPSHTATDWLKKKIQLFSFVQRKRNVFFKVSVPRPSFATKAT